MTEALVRRLAGWPAPRLAGGLLVLQVAALWPHGVWLLRRLGDGSDEPWGLLALLAVAFVVWHERARLAAVPGNATLLGAGALTLLAALAGGGLPPILAAAIALLALATLLAGLLPANRPRAALVLLVLMTLPLGASLNFYLGYPLRWLCAQGAAPLIGLFGVAVTPDGAALAWNGRRVLVDAPCAGIAMLWVGAFAALLLSYLNDAGWRRVLLNLGFAGAVVIGANVLRNAVLFFKEAGLVSWPAWSHEVVGLAAFALAFYPIYRFDCWRRSC